MKNKRFTVLVTRPEPHASSLSSALFQHEFNSIICPTIAFAPLDEPRHIQKMLATLPEYDWGIFISPQAVAAWEPYFKTLPLTPRTKWAAVGETTAKALEELGVSPVIYPKKGEGSLALLNHPAFQFVEKHQIALIKGLHGRETLTQELSARGALVTEMNVYQRVLPQFNVEKYASMINANDIDMIVCTSFEGASNLKTLFNSICPFLLTIPLVVVSSRIKSLAHHLGFQRIWVSEGANHNAIVDQLMQVRKKWQTKS